MASRSQPQAKAREIDPQRLRELIEHVRKRAFERIGIDFEITDARYGELRARCRERRGTYIGYRGHGEIWHLTVWRGVVLYVIYKRREDELVTVVSETMFQENWVATYPGGKVRRRR